MRAWALFAAVALCGPGCHGLTVCGPCPSHPPCEEAAECPPERCKPARPAPCREAAPVCSAPEVEVKPAKEVHVKVPPQKIVVNAETQVPAAAPAAQAVYPAGAPALATPGALAGGVTTMIVSGTSGNRLALGLEWIPIPFPVPRLFSVPAEQRVMTVPTQAVQMLPQQVVAAPAAQVVTQAVAAPPAQVVAAPQMVAAPPVQAVPVPAVPQAPAPQAQLVMPVMPVSAPATPQAAPCAAAAPCGDRAAAERSTAEAQALRDNLDQVEKKLQQVEALIRARARNASGAGAAPQP